MCRCLQNFTMSAPPSPLGVCCYDIGSMSSKHLNHSRFNYEPDWDGPYAHIKEKRNLQFNLTTYSHLKSVLKFKIWQSGWLAIASQPDEGSKHNQVYGKGAWVYYNHNCLVKCLKIVEMLYNLYFFFSWLPLLLNLLC